MLNKLSIQIALCLSIFIYTNSTNAQNTSTDLSQIKFLYDEFRFEEAISFGHKVLKGGEIQSAKHFEYIHQYMAYSFFNIGEIDSARFHFLALLTVNPQIELDPVNTSPKIIEFYNQTKANSLELNDNQKILSYPKYIFINDKRPDAAWRSAILPGWGQYYKGQHTRGYIFGGTFLASATILTVSLVNENKYKDSYLNSTEPTDISNYYDKYNSWSKTRQISTYTTIGIWLLSFADALWSDYPRIELGTSNRELNSAVFSIRYLF